MAFPIKLDIFSTKDAKNIQFKFLKYLNVLRNDYLKIDDKSFYNDFVFHESVLMKCLAYRFADETLWLTLKKKLLPYLERVLHKKNLNIDDFFIHPLFYCRLSDPKYKNENSNTSHFLDSQPHYDRSFNLEAFTFWLALEEINKETGGLCFFEIDENIKNITEWTKEHPDYSDYHSQKNNIYLNIVSNSMSGGSEEETSKNINKIITNVVREIVIDK